MVTLKRTTTEALTQAYLSVFARHGIPNIVRSDNGTPLVSREMHIFAQELGFQIVTSSPHFPQSNGQAERAVEICKGILKKNTNPYIGLLAYRSSPLECGLSPAELLFGRKIRTTVPITLDQLEPSWPDLKQYRESWKTAKDLNSKYFDRRHRARSLKPLQPGSEVWITDLKRNGKVIGRGTTDRDYLIKTGDREVRRNRRFLIPVPENDDSKPHWADYPRGTSERTISQDPPETLNRSAESAENGEEEMKGLPVKKHGCDGTWNAGGRRREEEGREEHREKKEDGTYVTRYGRTVRPPMKYC